MIYATGLITMMMAGAAMGRPARAATAGPRKNGRDQLFDGKSYFTYSDDSKGDSHGFVGEVYDHFSKFNGYEDGDDGGDHTVNAFHKESYSTVSSATCSSYASAHAFAQAIDAHIGITKYAILEFCKPSWDGHIKHVHDYAEAHAGAVAKAVTASQADCVSEGNAFGCTSATATAEAWAEAKAEAHAAAVAKAFDECEERYGCPVDVASLSVAKASTFIDMTVDVFSRSEVYACTKGNEHAWAAAYSNCAAVAYAKIWTEAYAKAYLDTGCAKSEAATQVGVETGAEWYTIEGCQRYNDDDGNAGSTTYGSQAHAYADEIFPPLY